MLKKTITFEDLDGNPVTDDFYFNLNKSELIQMQLEEDGGMEAKLTQIVASQKGSEVMRIVDDILRRAYGVRSDDNRRFMKTEGLFDEFKETDAYNVLFLELCTDAGASAAFMNALMPADLVEQVKTQMQNVTDVQLPASEPAHPKKVSEMSTEELQRAYLEKMQEQANQ